MATTATTVSLNADERYAYENANASVKWRHIFSDRFTGVLTAGYDHYATGL